jgi:arylsulfatase A-like enzyme
MKKFRFAVLALAFLPVTVGFSLPRNPNIVFIVADDLGFGDTGVYGATKIPTPNVDRLGREGLRFTDAHATSATCTPSRYAFLTGQYPWRKAGTGILPGDAPLIIDPNHATLASILKTAGYRTAVVGKWHLGLGGPGGADWNGEIKPGPNELGFDYSFIMAATGDRVPCVYIENHRVAGLDPKDPIKVSYEMPVDNEPTGKTHPELMKMKLSSGHDGTIVDGISRIGFMSGGTAARWKDEDRADILIGKAVDFIRQSTNAPFFLYFATHDPHVPRVPHPRFVGKSGCGVRGDVIVEFDWCVGEIIAAVEKIKTNPSEAGRDTLIILTSDNGPVLDDGYRDGSIRDLNGHKPAGPLRGGKYSIYEGGTRVPFIVWWPKRVKPGVTDALICLMDLPASLGALTGGKIPPGDAPDSANVLSALLGESKVGREKLVEHDGARVFGYRDGVWKFIAPIKGGMASRGASPDPQLYNLGHDLGEATNLAPAESPTEKRLAQELIDARKPK